jgi:hypothetical protein
MCSGECPGATCGCRPPDSYDLKETPVAKTIVGSFDNFEEAQQVMRELQQGGFPQSDISIIANNVTGQYGTEGQLPADAPATLSDTGSGAATGAAAGGLLGGAAGLIVGLMGLAIPGIGPIVAAGPLAATLAGAGAGALAGGLIGGLTGAGVPEEEAHVYAEAVRRGGALVTVRADGARAEDAAAIMRSCGAVDVERRAELWREKGWKRHDPAAKPYSVEELQRERSLYTGSLGVTVSENVAARSQTQRNRPSMQRDPAFDEHRDHFRMHHSDDYGAAAFDDFEPAYRYGWTLGNDQRYRGRDWSAIETDARRDWESKYPDNTWERFKSAVRRGWERTSDAIERAVPGDSDRDGR